MLRSSKSIVHHVQVKSGKALKEGEKSKIKYNK
jgi:hypothetical protein